MKRAPVKQRLGKTDPAEMRAVTKLLRRSDREIESTISGVSMGATIPDGSTIRITYHQPEAMSVGQVIAFIASNGLVAHRIVARGYGRRGRSFLITRGDATCICDAPVQKADVLGAVTAYKQWSGWCDVPAPPRLPGLRGAVAAGLANVVGLGLSIDVRLGTAITALARHARRLKRRLTRTVGGVPISHHPAPSAYASEPRNTWTSRSEEALGFRKLALQILTDVGGVSDDTWDAANLYSSYAWRLFNTIEHCALPLSSRMGPNHISRLSSDVQQLLKESAAYEFGRTVLARNELNKIAAIARERDLRPIVLKGGISAFTRQSPVDLVDIDILLPNRDAHELATVLDDRGYRSGFSSARHMTERFGPGSSQVEIHVTLDRQGSATSEEIWNRAVPLLGADYLWQLAPSDHLWHILTHSTLDHPMRRGRLRDLVVTAGAIEQCTEDDLAVVRDRIGHHEKAELLEALLHVANSVLKHELPGDPFQAVALDNYMVHAALRRLKVPHRFFEDLKPSVFALLHGPEERRQLWADTRLVSLARSPRRIISWAEHLHPKFGRAWRVLVRVVYRMVMFVIALPLAGAIRWAQSHLKTGPIPRPPT
ncbi:MAG: nucleotidyltransferase family protein [Gemmatimonadales bacterium]